jgi:hypothetical protein
MDIPKDFKWFPISIEKVAQQMDFEDEEDRQRFIEYNTHNPTLCYKGKKKWPILMISLNESMAFDFYGTYTITANVKNGINDRWYSHYGIPGSLLPDVIKMLEDFNGRTA